MRKRIICIITLLMLILSGCTRAETEITPPTLIAHAGGAVYGLKYTNSTEALDMSYKNGHRFIELDFERTSDGEIVLIHDWESMALRLFGSEGQLTEEQFLQSETLSDLTLLDIDLLAKWLKKHDGAYIITDVKNDNTGFISEIKERYPTLFERFIPQAYTFDEYSELKELGCKHVILTAYAIFDKTDDEIDEFAMQNGLWALTVEADKLSEERLGKLNKSGVTVYAHTVNDLYIYEELSQYGLHGIYTDHFTPIGFPY